MPSKNDLFQRSVKIQFSRNPRGTGSKARVTIPARIQRQTAIEAGSYMRWSEPLGQIRCVPVREPSLSTTAVFFSGKEQLFCSFPGVFCQKSGLTKGAEFTWTLRGQQVHGFLDVSRLPRKILRARDKDMEKSRSVPFLLLKQEGRVRLTLPAEFCRLLNLQSGHVIRWKETTTTIQAEPHVQAAMNSTAIEWRKSGIQVEIPRFLCLKYQFQNGICVWAMKQGKLLGTISVKSV